MGLCEMNYHPRRIKAWVWKTSYWLACSITYFCLRTRWGRDARKKTGLELTWMYKSKEKSTCLLMFWSINIFLVTIVSGYSLLLYLYPSVHGYRYRRESQERAHNQNTQHSGLPVRPITCTQPTSWGTGIHLGAFSAFLNLNNFIIS